MDPDQELILYLTGGYTDNNERMEGPTMKAKEDPKWSSISKAKDFIVHGKKNEIKLPVSLYPHELESGDGNMSPWSSIATCNGPFVPKTEDNDPDSTNNLNCYYCCKQFSNNVGYNQHMASHVTSRDLSYTCHKCLQTFVATFFLRQHFKTVHDADEDEYHCQYCDMSFMNISLLVKHSATHSKKMLLKCEACNITFTSLINYNKHIRNTCCFAFCTDCGRLCSGKGMRGHNIVTYSPRYGCTQCGSVFYDLSYLTSHRLQEHKNANYRCLICKGCFVTPESYKLHMSSHTKLAHYICDFCTLDFSKCPEEYESHLLAHLMPQK